MEGVIIMSFFKKLGETMKDTASTIGAKTSDMMETGKLKLQKSQLENLIEAKKTEIGNLVYIAYKQNSEPDSVAITKLFEEVKELENQITDIEEKLHKETVKAAAQPNAEPSSGRACSNCGQEIASGAKFCNNCGQPQ